LSELNFIIKPVCPSVIGGPQGVSEIKYGIELYHPLDYLYTIVDKITQSRIR